MNTLNDFLHVKRLAIQEREQRIADGTEPIMELKATCVAAGRSGVRHIRIRDHQILNDSPPNFAGFDLGPSTPETMIGVLAACVVHIFEMHAAAREVPLESLEVEAKGSYDPRAGKPGFDDVPIHPYGIEYVVHVVSPASEEDIQAVFTEVERTCPVLSLLRHPQDVRSTVNHVQP